MDALVVEAPEEGQVWADGLSPGFSWVVSSVDGGRVGINLVNPDGDVTPSFMSWPVDRWSALVGKQLLTLKRDPAELREAIDMAARRLNDDFLAGSQGARWDQLEESERAYWRQAASAVIDTFESGQ